jgi:hypothetical protein
VNMLKYYVAIPTSYATNTMLSALVFYINCTHIINCEKYPNVTSSDDRRMCQLKKWIYKKKARPQKGTQGIVALY